MTSTHASPRDAPDPSIFLFSASWRSGSTLVQRFLSASGEVLMWGETGGALCSLGHAIAGWEQITADWRKSFPTGLGGNGEAAYKDFLEANKDERPHMWIANLGPPMSEIINELRSFFASLYGTRVAPLGYRRYGFKETRCGIDVAEKLRTLYPEARFIFLVRHPFDVMLSIKRRNWMGFPVEKKPLEYYADHWMKNASAMRKTSVGLTVRYEDFVIDPEVRQKLLEYCSIEKAPSSDFVTDSKVDWRPQNQRTLTLKERIRLWSLLRHEMRAYGYTWK